MNIRMKQLFLLSAAVAMMAGRGLSQGSLTPPAAVVPNMKTLAQIEPRTPISAGGYTITQPGSYYLTTNITVSSDNAIIVNAGNVKLDLNGFTISSTSNPSSGYAIILSGMLTNVSIVNGFIFSPVTNNGAAVYGGAGWTGGISGSGSEYNVRVENVRVHGATYYGIALGTGTTSLVKSCEVENVGSIGIQADLILNCSVNAGGYGGTYGVQGGTVCGTRVACYNGTALSASQNVADCDVTGVNGTAIAAPIVSNSSGTSSSSIGVNASCVINNSTGASTGNSGIIAYVGRNSFGITHSASSYAYLAAYLATGCSAVSFGNAGIYSGKSLIACDGTVLVSGGAATSASFKYNMP